MAWLYVPESAALNSGSGSHSGKTTAPCAGLSVIPTQSQSYSHECETGACTTPQSGMMCPPSMGVRGAAKLTSSQRVSHASPGAKPGVEKALPTSDGSGPTLQQSSKPYHHDSSSGGGAEMVEADLVRLGYEVSAVMVEASAAGLPHRRRRLFILGHANRHGRVGTRIHLQSRGQELPWVHSTRPSTDLGRVVGWRVPGFSDSPQAWSAWLERWPQAEPCLRRSTHGPSSGVDRNRIRVLGNAVVPECAALAFQWLSFASGIASERD